MCFVHKAVTGYGCDLLCIWIGMHMRGGGVHGRGVCVAGGGVYMAGETATAADGTHPTGMFSCLCLNSLKTFR